MLPSEHARIFRSPVERARASLDRVKQTIDECGCWPAPPRHTRHNIDWGRAPIPPVGFKPSVRIAAREHRRWRAAMRDKAGAK